MAKEPMPMEPMMPDAEASDEHMGEESETPTESDAETPDTEHLEALIADMSEAECRALKDMLDKRLSTDEDNKKLTLKDFAAE